MHHNGEWARILQEVKGALVKNKQVVSANSVKYAR